MKFSTKRMILKVITMTFVAAFLIVFVLEEFFAISITSPAVLAVLAIILVADFVLSGIWHRCPHCDSHLNDLSERAVYCPFCGEELE